MQNRPAPPDRHVRQPAHHGVPGHTQLAAPGAPAGPLGDVVGLEDPAGQHRTVLAHKLAGHGQPEPIEQADGVEIRTVESRLSHVEVFQKAGVGTAIIGRPRPSCRPRRASSYTLIREEPVNPSLITWKVSSTRVAWGRVVDRALAYPRNGSREAT